MSRYHACPCCSCPGVEPDFRFCGACEGLKGQTVNSPDGPARVVSLRPHGSIVVAPMDDSYCREFRRSQLTIIAPQPAAIAAAEPLPDVCPAAETAAALARLEQEEETRLDRVWKANRLELLLRPWPVWTIR